MKRPPTVQHLSEQRNDVPKKRKIQPVFLGALGSAFTHQSELSAATSSVDPPQSQALVSETALHVNPGLIDRVSSSNEFTDHQQRASSPAIKAEFEAGEEHSMLSNYSLLNSTIESSIVERQQQPALLTELRPLPELRPQNEAQMPSLSQAVDVHNLANATLPGPQPQNTFAIPIPMGATCQTDQIVAKNSLNNKRGVKYAKIQAFFGREQRWAHTISSPFLLLRANRSWVISTHEDNSLVVFCTRTGKVRFCLHTDWPTAILTIRDDNCSALDTQAQLSTWDLRTCTRILHTSIKTLLIGCPTGTLQIVQLCLSANGVPLLVLSNGDVFVFSRSLASWLSLNMAKSFLLAQLPSLQFIAQWQPGGLISILSDALKSDKLVDSRPSGSVQSEEADSANEEAQLELLARAAIELHSPGEYRLLVSVYLQRLLKRQKVDKMAEYLTELRAIPNSPVPLETIIADIRPFLESTGLTVDALFCARGPWRQRELEASLALLT